MGEGMEGKKVGEITLGLELKGVDELQARLDEAAGHIHAAREILDSLAGGVTIGADVPAAIRRPAAGTARPGAAKREALAACLAGYLEGAGCSGLLDSPDGDAVEGLSVDLEALEGL